MWVKIASDLRKKLNVNVTDANCINRWKVIERNYKKFVENEKSTGRGRKYFEYVHEMEAILGRKKSIHPELLLSSDTVHHFESIPLSEKSELMSLPSCAKVNENLKESVTHENNENENMKSATTKLKSKVNARKRSYLELIRADRKAFSEEKLVIEKEKLAELKRKNKLVEERNIILRENMGLKLAEHKRQNDLLQEQNAILRENKCQCQCRNESIL